MKPHPPEDYTAYPESSLRNRFKLAHDWIPDNCQRLLDGGCAYGYGTRHFKAKAAEVWGADPNEQFIAVARRRYPGIQFLHCGLEQLPFEDEFFDVIILNDVLEHVADERVALQEMFRVLRPGGTLIITTPHRGLFSFLDTDNYAYRLRTKVPNLYRRLFRLKYGKFPDRVKPGYEQIHRHYRREDFVRMLEDCDFQGRYEINRVFRSGLLIGVLTSNLFELLSMVVGVRWARRLVGPFIWLSDVDYFVPYGVFSYNIAIRVKKHQCKPGLETICPPVLESLPCLVIGLFGMLVDTADFG